MIEFDFASVGNDGEPTFTKAQLHRIMNVEETEISLNTSNTRAGGRPAVSFHDPHLNNLQMEVRRRWASTRLSGRKSMKRNSSR